MRQCLNFPAPAGLVSRPQVAAPNALEPHGPRPAGLTPGPQQTALEEQEPRGLNEICRLKNRPLHDGLTNAAGMGP
jgi:hypothetical protein